MDDNRQKLFEVVVAIKQLTPHVSEIVSKLPEEQRQLMDGYITAINSYIALTSAANEA